MNSLKRTLDGLNLPRRDPRVQWLSLRESSETTTYRSARDGKPETNSSEISHGVMVEVMAEGHVGYAASSARDAASLERAAEAALGQALASARHAIHVFGQGDRPSHEGRYRSPTLKPLNSRTPGEINDLLVKITEKLKVSDKIVKAQAALRTVETRIRYASTTGADWEQDFTLVSSHFEATAQEGSIVQYRSDQGGFARSRQGGLELFETAGPNGLWERVDKVGAQAVELLTAEECPTETTSLVLMPDQMILQIHESIGHPLEIDRIIGDERNYAGWSFVKPEDFGRLQYGSPLMNVTFDPTVEGEFASYAFDDTGNRAERLFLIENGLLKRGLGGFESQLRSKAQGRPIPGVANTRASTWSRPPIDRMANLNLEPGTSSFKDIIGQVERGVLMEANRSWSIDDFRNKFQFGCEYGKLIENGKLTRTLKNPNYRGVTVPFWSNLKAVGDPSTREVLGTPNCGKGEPNQVIRVGHATPVCLFGNIEVFGGGK